MILDTNILPLVLRKDGSVGLTADWPAGAYDIKALSFSIGANKLTTSEWAFLDGQDQAVKIASNPQFAGLVTSGNILPQADNAYSFGSIDLRFVSLYLTGNIFNGAGAAITVAEAEDAHDHSQDNTQAHSDYLLNSGDDTTSGKIIATGFILGDTEYAEFGVGGLTGALGCDGRLFSDGSHVQLQIESPSGVVANPSLEFTYHDYIGAGIYMPVIRGSTAAMPGYLILDKILYVKDTVGETDASVFITDHSDDTKYLILTFNSASDYGSIGCSGDLQMTPAGDVLINPSGTGIRIGSLVAPSGILDVESAIKIGEQAAADADVAGYGQLWVKNTTPCELWFTDDAGLDTQIV